MLPLPVDRTTVIEGPAIATYQGVSFWIQDSLTVTPKKQTFDLKSTALGTFDTRLKDIFWEISFRHDGRIAADLLNITYGSYATTLPGQSIFGPVDKPLTVQTINNQSTSLTFPCAALTKIPQFMADPTKTALGSMTFTAIRGRGIGISAANSSVVINTNSVYAVPAGVITGASNANPLVITTAAVHGLKVGDKVTNAGVTGNTNANGTFTVATVPSTTTYSLYQLGTVTPIAGNAAYGNGGTFVRANTGDALNNSDVITTPFSNSWATTLPSGAIDLTSDANPDVITSGPQGNPTPHGLNVNDKVFISGATGDTAINGTWFVLTVPSASTFTISATQGGAAVAGNGAYTGGGTFQRANVWDSFDSEEGFMLDFNLSLKTKRSSSNGIYDMQFSDLTVTATAKAIGMAEADVVAALNIQGSTAAIGASTAASSQNLHLGGAGLYACVYQATLTEGPLVFDSENNRIGALKWRATRSMLNNALQPLFAVSTQPIS